MDSLLFPYRHKAPLILVENQVSSLFFTISVFAFALALLPLKFYVIALNIDGIVKSLIYYVVAVFQVLGILHVLPRKTTTPCTPRALPVGRI